MKLQVIDPLLKYFKAPNFTLKCFPTKRIPYGMHAPVLSMCSFCHASQYLPSRPFTSLSYKPTLISKYYATSYNKSNALISVREAHSNGNQGETPSAKPILLYVQNPFRWLVNKFDFGILRRAWDPEFRENEFREGAKFAVSSITHLMSDNNFEDLNGLLTPPAINLLRYEVETKWTDVQRRNAHLTKDDIKVALPQRVRFHKIAGKKFCDIDMVFLALKQSKYEEMNATIFMEIKVRFHRDYTDGLLPEWTVSMFRVTRFSILPR